MRARWKIAAENDAKLAACLPAWRSLLMGHCVPGPLVPADSGRWINRWHWELHDRGYRICLVTNVGCFESSTYDAIWPRKFDEALDNITSQLLLKGGELGRSVLANQTASIRRAENAISKLEADIEKLRRERAASMAKAEVVRGILRSWGRL